jgi:DNA topoisomerase-1
MTVPILYSPNVNSDLYNYALQTAFDVHWRLYDPDFALAQDPEAVEKIKRDATIMHAVQMRLRMVAAKNWRMVPCSDRAEDRAAAEIIEELFKEIRSFRAARYALAYAFLVGRTYAQIYGIRRALPLYDGFMRTWWVPTGLKDIDRRRVRRAPRRDPKTGELRTVDEYYSVMARNWVEADLSSVVSVVFDNEEGRLGYGRGLVECIYFYYYCMSTLLKEGLQGAERWSQGFLIGKIDSSAPGTTTQTAQQMRDAFIAAFEKTKARHIAVIDKNDDAQLLSPSDVGNRIVMDLRNALKEEITQVILGSVLPTGGGGERGSLARAEVEQDSMASIVDFDRGVLDEAITRDLVGLVWRMNQPVFRQMGLGSARAPRFETISQTVYDPQVQASVIETLTRVGVPLRRDEVYERTGFTPPSLQDDVFEPSTGATASPGETPPEDMVSGWLENDSEAFSFAAAPPRRDPRTIKRLPSGEFAPKGQGEVRERKEAGPSSDGPVSSDDSSSSEGTGQTTAVVGASRPPRQGAPGSQLPEAQRAALARFGVTKWPPLDAKNLVVHDLEAPDVDRRAVMTWTDRSGKLQHAYTAAFHRENAERKWSRVQRWAPQVEEFLDGFRTDLATHSAGSPRHMAATIAAVIAHTGLRPGKTGESEARGHYGVTTLRAKHVSIADGVASFDFVGKSGKRNVASVDDPAVVAALASYKALAPSDDAPLFPGATPESARSTLPVGMKLKDFRTILATKAAENIARAWSGPPPPLHPDPNKAKRQVLKAVREMSAKVAARLNNTPAVARASYIHPRIFEEWARRIGVPEEVVRVA